MKTVKQKVEKIIERDFGSAWKSKTISGETVDKIQLLYQKEIAKEKKEMLREIDKFTVYYRSKFSLRVDRNETKEEMQTEMIELKNLTDLLSHNKLDKII